MIFPVVAREGESRGSSIKEGKDFGFCSCFEGLGLRRETKEYFPSGMLLSCYGFWMSHSDFCVFFLIFNMLLHRFIHAKETFLTHFSVAHADADM